MSKTTSRSAHLTTLLGEMRRGDEHARDELVTIVYPELRRIAAHYLRHERQDHTLHVTGLVHEVYMRLFGAEPAGWENRAHFFAAVAREMRHLLVDYARARNAQKRVDGHVRVSLSDVEPALEPCDEDVVALDEAL